MRKLGVQRNHSSWVPALAEDNLALQNLERLDTPEVTPRPDLREGKQTSNQGSLPVATKWGWEQSLLGTSNRGHIIGRELKNNKTD